MAKLVFGMNQSLDGYVDHDHAAFAPPGPRLFHHFIEQVRGLTGSVYGRRLYEIMRYWDEDRPEWDAAERDFAVAWRGQPKWVVSCSLKSVGPNATLVEGDVEAAIRGCLAIGFQNGRHRGNFGARKAAVGEFVFYFRIRVQPRRADVVETTLGVRGAEQQRVELFGHRVERRLNRLRCRVPVVKTHAQCQSRPIQGVFRQGVSLLVAHHLQDAVFAVLGGAAALYLWLQRRYFWALVRLGLRWQAWPCAAALFLLCFAEFYLDGRPSTAGHFWAELVETNGYFLFAIAAWRHATLIGEPLLDAPL